MRIIRYNIGWGCVGEGEGGDVYGGGESGMCGGGDGGDVWGR